MARSKKRRSHKKVALPAPPPPAPPPPLPPAQEPSPFMSLPTEIRLMIYDALVPNGILLDGRLGFSTRVPHEIRALMRVKVIRAELLAHLFARHQFIWTDTSSWPYSNRRWESFKHYPLPFIKSLTLWLDTSTTRSEDSKKLFHSLLRWIRFRSLRSHLYPWHLKKLTLGQAHSPPPHMASLFSRFRTAADVSRDVDKFLIEAPVVPGLDSLDIVLNNHPGEEAAKKCLEQYASCEVEGRIGYWQVDYNYYRPNLQGHVGYWLCLQENHIVRVPV